MDYYRETADQGAWFDSWTQWQVGHPGIRGVALGLGSYLNTADGALAQLGRAPALGGLGGALYSYAGPPPDPGDASAAEPPTFAPHLPPILPPPPSAPDPPPPPPAPRPS